MPAATEITAAVPGWAQSLLQQRGIVGSAAVERYLTPSLKELPDPGMLAGINAAVDRIVRALDRSEDIVVFGDYDVDGVCSAALLTEFLRQAGGRVDYYIPDRTGEGYGLNRDAVTHLASKAQLLITTDCGITAHEEIALAGRLGLDVVVVDHHQVPEALPPAVACLNPHRADCAYPFKPLCAAGVAFMVAAAVRRTLRERGDFRQRPEPDLRDQLDVLAIATVADMVTLQGINRTLVSSGLKRMARKRRVGLNALLEVCGVDPRRVQAADLGFRIGPRINARGRVRHAGCAVELLLTSDPARARALAQLLEDANQERRVLEKQVVEAAVNQVENLGLEHQGALVVSDPSWHPGVVGLAATRLVHRFHRPAAVIGTDGKGSVRGVAGVDVVAALGAGSTFLERFGGHPAAGGLTLRPGGLEGFRGAFVDAVEGVLGPPPYTATLDIDLEASGPQLNLDTVDVLERLGPFGQNNPEPMWMARALPVRSARVVGETHLKLTLGSGWDGIGFGLGHLASSLPEAVDVAFRLERNAFRGTQRLQLRVEDLRAPA